MGLWAELNDFSEYDKEIPCVLCKEKAVPTLLGGHFKCSKCNHLFNQDGSKVSVECYCEICKPEPVQAALPESKKPTKKKKKK